MLIKFKHLPKKEDFINQDQNSEQQNEIDHNTKDREELKTKHSNQNSKFNIIQRLSDYGIYGPGWKETPRIIASDLRASL